MLSKVLRRAESAEIQPLVFPLVKGQPPASRGTHATSAPGEGTALAGRIRELESRIAIESRQAFEKGKQEAEQAARAEIQPVLQRLAASAAEVLSLRAELRQRAEADVVQLALLIARRVLHRQLAVDETALTALAKVAFDRLNRSESYRVTIHPRFAASISSALPAMQAARVQIEPDPACAPGTLIIHSPEGTIDASIDAQLDEIGRGLTDRIELT
jgi:flagellar assembly protein FliH